MAVPLRVTVSIERIDAAPGDSFNFDVTVRNTSDIVEHYVVELLGLPAGATSRAEPDVAKLRPGESATAAVQLSIPVQAPAAAGLYTLGVLVRSKYREEVSRCEELPLALAAVDDVTVRVEPEVATGGRSARYTVQVTNGGNFGARVALGMSDPEQRVSATFDPPVLDLPQGATAHSFLSVRAPVPWNKEKQRVLTVEAAGSGVRGKGTATFVQLPRFASKLVRTAGMLGAVLVVAGAVLAAALIARAGNDDEQQQAGNNQTPPAVTSGAPAPATSAPPSPSESPSAAPTSAPAESPTAAPPADPITVNVTQPFGDPANGVLPADAFRQFDLALTGRPERNSPDGCDDARSVAVTGDATNGRSLSASRQDDATACKGVPVSIEGLRDIAAIQVVVAGDDRRQMEVFYTNGNRSIQDDLILTTEERRGEIDFVVVRGVPDGAGDDPPPAAIRTIRYIPATT
ncbi:hypothetical protein K1W54_16535 [Micromonospora sp. CPCC 205371]|nr:hypothetical protein [Micromonospora sp. CPCC 205371]